MEEYRQRERSGKAGSESKNNMRKLWSREVIMDMVMVGRGQPAPPPSTHPPAPPARLPSEAPTVAVAAAVTAAGAPASAPTATLPPPPPHPEKGWFPPPRGESPSPHRSVHTVKRGLAPLLGASRGPSSTRPPERQSPPTPLRPGGRGHSLSLLALAVAPSALVLVTVTAAAAAPLRLPPAPPSLPARPCPPPRRLAG